jgi:hypothetical protein
MAYTKKGSLVKTQKGELAIKADENRAYKVDEVVAVVWNMCDGKRDKKQIAGELLKSSGESGQENEKKVSDAVSQVLDKLGELGLVQESGSGG